MSIQINLMRKLPVKTHLKNILRPGWPDEARIVVQLPMFYKALGDQGLSGLCLNAGCGQGIFCDFIDSFPDVNGVHNIDIEPHLDERVGHEIFSGSLTELPFDNDTYDSAICTEVIEHIEDHQKAASELCRVLKAGGILLVSVPTPPAPFDADHVREGYTFEEMSQLLVGNGFEILNHRYCFHFFLRIFMSLWSFQHRVFGRNKRNYFPYFLVLLFGYLDKFFPVGKPWDIILIAKKKAS